MVNFGDLARWKIRAQGSAHYASWRTLYNRTGDSDPNSHNWPFPATLSASPGSDALAVDELWNTETWLMTETIRGESIVDPETGTQIDVKGRLEMSENVHNANATSERQLHQLRSLLPNGGRYRFDLEQNLLDEPWQFHNMHYSDNLDRRVRLWYGIETDELAAFDASLEAQMEIARQALLANSTQADLDPLDRDDEFLLYTGRPVEFHPPRVFLRRQVQRRELCAADHASLQLVFVDPLLDQIRGTETPEHIPGVPEEMALAFIQLYQGEIERLQALIPQPPGVDQQIQQLQEKVSQLQTFIGLLPQQ